MESIRNKTLLKIDHQGSILNRAGRIASALILSMTFSVPAFAAETPSVSAERLPALPSGEHVETAENAPKIVEGIQMSDLAKAWEQARRSGDEAQVRALEERMGYGKPLTGEAAGPMGLIPSDSVGGVGDAEDLSKQAEQGVDPDAGNSTITAFSMDRKVRSSNPTTGEFNQSIVSDSMGNLYVAWQDDAFAPEDYIQVYWSEDGGINWVAYGYVLNSSATLSDPCLAVGEGSSNKLLLTYTMDDGVNIPVPEVATADLYGPNPFTVSGGVPVWTFWEGYAKPVIWTDSLDFSGWYAYLTCEAAFDSAVNNINVAAFRSTDSGATWGDANVPAGNTDAYEWRDPDGSYCPATNRNFTVFYQNDDNSLYQSFSDDFGVTYSVETLILTMPSTAPNYRVDPEVEAAVNHDHVMISCTYGNTTNLDQIGYTYSSDNGATWTVLFVLPGMSSLDDFAQSLSANEGGQSWHLCYTSDHRLYTSRRTQDLSNVFNTNPNPIDDMARVSHVYPKQDVASHWDYNTPVFAWADYRDVSPDYDTYTDGDRYLSASDYQLSASSGGSIKFLLEAGGANAGRTYFMFGSVTGTSPGTPLPGGFVTLPINWDVFTNLTLNLANTAVFPQFIGNLDGSGMGSAGINFGSVPGSGFTLNFAYALNQPWNFVSNPIPIEIVP